MNQEIFIEKTTPDGVSRIQFVNDNLRAYYAKWNGSYYEIYIVNKFVGGAFSVDAAKEMLLEKSNYNITYEYPTLRKEDLTCDVSLENINKNDYVKTYFYKYKDKLLGTIKERFVSGRIQYLSFANEGVIMSHNLSWILSQNKYRLVLDK